MHSLPPPTCIHHLLATICLITDSAFFIFDLLSHLMLLYLIGAAAISSFIRTPFLHPSTFQTSCQFIMNDLCFRCHLLQKLNNRDISCWSSSNSVFNSEQVQIRLQQFSLLTSGSIVFNNLSNQFRSQSNVIRSRLQFNSSDLLCSAAFYFVLLIWIARSTICTELAFSLSFNQHDQTCDQIPEAITC